MSIRGSGISATTGVTASVRNIQREQRLLAWLSSAGLKHKAATPPPDMENVDWHRLVALARHHRVVPLIWRNLEKRPDVVVPEWVSEDLRDAYRHNALHGLRLTAHLVRITGKLSEAGIRAVPLKGICLAARYYRDIASRHAGDIDLLIAPADLDRAHQLLLALGYLRVANKTHVVVPEPFTEEMYFRFHFIFISPDGVVVELHFRLHFNPDILAVDLDDILAAGATVPLGKASLPVMPDALQFVFLATHGRATNGSASSGSATSRSWSIGQAPPKSGSGSPSPGATD